MMIPRFLTPALAAVILMTGLTTAPVAAQRNSAAAVMTIFGNDKCPTDSDGNEIVVCRRLPENERQRIPQELRQSGRDKESGADRTATLDSVGKSGVGSCSAVGSGGASGCARARAKAACDEDKANGKECGFKF